VTRPTRAEGPRAGDRHRMRARLERAMAYLAGCCGRSATWGPGSRGSRIVCRPAISTGATIRPLAGAEWGPAWGFLNASVRSGGARAAALVARCGHDVAGPEAVRTPNVPLPALAAFAGFAVALLYRPRTAPCCCCARRFGTVLVQVEAYLRMLRLPARRAFATVATRAFIPFSPSPFSPPPFWRSSFSPSSSFPSPTCAPRRSCSRSRRPRPPQPSSPHRLAWSQRFWQTRP